MAFGGALWESRQEAADWMVSPLASSLGVEQEAADWMVSPPASSLGVEAGGSRHTYIIDIHIILYNIII